MVHLMEELSILVRSSGLFRLNAAICGVTSERRPIAHTEDSSCKKSRSQ